jgi:hypothetical protein
VKLLANFPAAKAAQTLDCSTDINLIVSSADICAFEPSLIPVAAAKAVPDMRALWKGNADSIR